MPRKSAKSKGPNGRFSPQMLLPLTTVKSAVELERGKFKLLCDASGGIITYAWLTNLMQGRVREPSFIKVVVLARLVGLKLQWLPTDSLNDAAAKIATEIREDLGLVAHRE